MDSKEVETTREVSRGQSIQLLEIANVFRLPFLNRVARNDWTDVDAHGFEASRE